MWSGNWNLDRIVLETKKKKFVPKFSGENWTGGKKWREIPANIYLFQVNNRNITKRCEVCSVEVKQAVEVVLVLYISNQHDFKRREDLKNANLESVWIEIFR